MPLSDRAETSLSVVLYSLCSGSLVLINKLTLHFIPLPSLVVTVQIWATLFFIYGSNFLGIISIDQLDWKFMKPYLIYTIMFALGVYANMRSLSSSNVETVIVFRSLSPLIVSFLDWKFLGREIPSRRSFISLSLIALGALGYANSDEEFQKQGSMVYMWPTLYLFLICIEMAYGKIIVKSVEFKTSSGPVQYSNLVSWIPMLIFAKFGGEYERIHLMQTEKGDASLDNFIRALPTTGLMYLAMGCVVGTAIGYSAWWCRAKVSATSFTLIGVMNKLLTIVVNYLIWDYHATPVGIACLCVCIVAGAFYQQAPVRTIEKKVEDYVDDLGSDLEMKVSTDENEGMNDGDRSESVTAPLLQQRYVKQ